MDLGIEGRSAIVCASSQGLGNACALVLSGGDLIKYVQIADSNRCYPGAGHIPFGDVIRGHCQIKIDFDDVAAFP